MKDALCKTSGQRYVLVHWFACEAVIGRLFCVVTIFVLSVADFCSDVADTICDIGSLTYL